MENIMKTLTSIALAAALALTAAVASGSYLSAQEKGSGSGSGADVKGGKGSGSGSDMGKMGKMSPKGDQSDSSKAYNQANIKMHSGMNITFTGDADVDFARSMVPHHRGAVDMARVVLQHGKDPELKKLAEDIIKAQETEIAFMSEWLKKKGK